MFSLRNKKNYLQIILNTPSYLELCSNAVNDTDGMANSVDPNGHFQLNPIPVTDSDYEQNNMLCGEFLKVIFSKSVLCIYVLHVLSLSAIP